MPPKRSTLDLAAFLDSAEARRLAGPGREEIRRVAEAFLAVSYDRCGKPPEELEEQELEEAVATALPSYFRPKDPHAEHAPAVLEAFLAHLGGVHVVTRAFELSQALDRALPRFLEAVRSGRNADRQVRSPEKPFEHGASKLGRNDPCSCGSGKKFKKCHGKNA